MNITTSPNTSSTPAGANATKHSLRRLWQAPIFLVGVTSLIFVCLSRHCDGDCGNRAVEREVDGARHQLAKADVNLETVRTMLMKVLQQGDQIPKKLSEVHFLLGTVELRLADRMEPAKALPLHQSARGHLEEADRLHVGPKDEGPLHYRLAKVAFYTNNNPAQVAELLARSADQAEEQEKAEAYNLLTEAYLRMKPPDYKAALAANTNLRTNIAWVSAEVLAPAQVQGGRLLLKLGRPEEARKVLERIGPLADKALQAEARWLRAQSFQSEQRWSDAATLWHAALNDVPEGSPKRPGILYALGYCYRSLDRPQDAIKEWETCCGSSTGFSVHAQAAALSLAEIYLQGGQHEQSLVKLTDAVHDLARPEDWKNDLFPLERAREVFENASLSYRKAGKFALAAQLLDQYEHLAAPGRKTAIEAETMADDGRARRTHAGNVTDPDLHAKEEEAARELLCKAGLAYVKTASAPDLAAEKRADPLWLAVSCYREAPDNTQVLAVIDRFLEVNQKIDRTGEALFIKGETLRAENNVSEAIQLYDQCVKYDTPFAYSARFQEAMIFIAQGNLDKAGDILEQNRSFWIDKPPGSATDTGALEKSLFALGALRFTQKNYLASERLLKEALDHFKDSPEAVRARFQYAESCRQLAIGINAERTGPSPPKDIAHLQEQFNKWMGQAALYYYELAVQLDKQDATAYLTQEEKIHVQFLAADCRFNLGRYEEALEFYEVLVDRYKQRTEKLTALGGAVRCLSALRRFDQVKLRLDEIELALRTMDGPDKEQWKQWVDNAKKPFMGLNPGKQ
jgi:tetratricopeptide (TPR) repeat protein